MALVAKPRAAGGGATRILDTSDARRPEAVRPFPGFPKDGPLITNLPLYLSVCFTAATLLLRNRICAMPAVVFAIAACFNAESLFVEGGLGPMQVLMFGVLSMVTSYTPLILDLTPRTMKTALP